MVRSCEKKTKQNNGGMVGLGVVGMKKGPWTPEEDQKLQSYIQQFGHGSWRSLPAKAGLKRCGKSCRLRWTNYLRPDIKRGKFSLEEERTIIQLHALVGNKWSTIAAYLPKRTDNEIKNYWNSHIKKRMTKMGIDPMTHKPKSDTQHLGSTLNHMAQWEAARLEAEARVVQKPNRKSTLFQPTYNLVTPTPTLHKTPSKDLPPQPYNLPCLDILKVWQNHLWSNYSINNESLQSLISNSKHDFKTDTSAITEPVLTNQVETNGSSHDQDQASIKLQEEQKMMTQMEVFEEFEFFNDESFMNDNALGSPNLWEEFVDLSDGGWNSVTNYNLAMICSPPPSPVF